MELPYLEVDPLFQTRRFHFCRYPIKYPCSLAISLGKVTGWEFLSFSVPTGSNNSVILA